MFEDSTFESTGRIHTRSRGWMVATLLFNGTILFALILIPLIYPEALPRQALSFLLTAPPPPPAPLTPPKEPGQPFRGHSEMPKGVVLAPQVIPRDPLVATAPERIARGEGFALDDMVGASNRDMGAFTDHHPVVVHPVVKGPVHIASVLAEGRLLYRPTPPYPAIAKAAGVEGTVVLQATTSKNGTIENLRVATGPAMLQQAALETVKSWRYRPYLLNNLPVEVETTVNVVFTLSR